MTKISFSKKHIIMSTLLALAIVGLTLIVWGILIQPKAANVNELKKQVDILGKDIHGEQEKIVKLKDLPALLETTMVAERPKLPNGMSLAEYFQGLAQKNTVSLQHMTFEDTTFFPVDEGAVDDENQIRCLTMSFDVISDSEPGLLSFVEHLENDERFTKVTQVTYRHNPDSVGEGSFAYSATVNLNMYYLSSYETGTPLAANNQDENK
ncbi:hypothetical protein I6N95_17275 [Vagococcus sp. BWB3-3]|uniref:Uncharacterized protein n=1 Tax=Vagococcus allomyrinae TaxID=2794353 RepID=A0A940P7E7_9ENTE|nr:hypothetical protein [Vagococcus allomyrinae]MBP1042772.1 hypothetical protein [Vagococcus allomyrinae]